MSVASPCQCSSLRRPHSIVRFWPIADILSQFWSAQTCVVRTWCEVDALRQATREQDVLEALDIGETVGLRWGGLQPPVSGWAGHLVATNIVLA